MATAAKSKARSKTARKPTVAQSIMKKVAAKKATFKYGTKSTKKIAAKYATVAKRTKAVTASRTHVQEIRTVEMLNDIRLRGEALTEKINRLLNLA